MENISFVGAEKLDDFFDFFCEKGFKKVNIDKYGFSRTVALHGVEISWACNVCVVVLLGSDFHFTHASNFDCHCRKGRFVSLNNGDVFKGLHLNLDGIK